MKTIKRITLREWDERLIDTELTAADRGFIRQFGKGKKPGIQIEELRKCVRIKTSSWIGVVRLDSIEIRVEPKLAGDNIRVVEMMEFATGIDLLRRFEKSHELTAKDDNLFDLLVLLLVAEAERLIQGGLLSSYSEEEDLLPVLRGRFLGDKQLLRRFGILDKLHCRFDDLSQNVIENQVLTAALASSVPFIINDKLRQRIRVCLGELAGCCDTILVDCKQAQSMIHYDRLNSHYRPAHELCWLILEQIGILNFQTEGSTSCFSFLLNMNQLFEQFVTLLIRKLLEPQGYRIQAQCKQSSVIRDAATGKLYANVIPDLRVFRGQESSFCLDAKYKMYDEKKVSGSDIYQAFLYAFAFSKHSDWRQAALLYPSDCVEGQVHRLKIHCADGSFAHIHAIGFHVPTVLDQLKSATQPTVMLRLKEFLPIKSAATPTSSWRS